jgi:hypothetical protein
MSKWGAKGEGGHILHCLSCSLREEFLLDGDEVSFVRRLELGRLLSWREACPISLSLFTRDFLLLRRARCQIGAHQQLRDF